MVRAKGFFSLEFKNKFNIGSDLYFTAPSVCKTKMYHYKAKKTISNRVVNVSRITKKEYEKWKKKK